MNQASSENKYFCLIANKSNQLGAIINVYYYNQKIDLLVSNTQYKSCMKDINNIIEEYSGALVKLEKLIDVASAYQFAILFRFIEESSLKINFNEITFKVSLLSFLRSRGFDIESY